MSQMKEEEHKPETPLLVRRFESRVRGGCWPGQTD